MIIYIICNSCGMLGAEHGFAVDEKCMVLGCDGVFEGFIKHTDYVFAVEVARKQDPGKEE